MNLTRRGGLSAVMVAALIAVGVVSASPTMAASATNTPPTGQCVVDTIHHDAQYKYSQVIPGQTETFHTEYRFRTRTVTYGEVEHKYVKSTYAFVDGGTTTVNGQVVSGHWVGGYANAWRAIPDSIINAVWGAGGIPSSVIGGTEDNPKGNVNLNVYGGPNASVQYYAATEQNPSGYTDWGPWSGWSTTNPGAASATREVEVDDTVSNNDGVAAKVVFYVEGGGQSDTNTDANWTDDTPPAPWVKIDGEEKAAYDEDVYGPCPPTNEECVTYTSVVVTSLAQLDLSETRSQGDSKLVANANHVWTWSDADNNQPGGKDQRKAAGYIDVPDFPLTQTGTLNIVYTGTGLGVGGQMLLDLDGDPSNNTLILDGEAGDSIGVFEPGSYGQNVWLANIQPGLDVSGANVPHVGGGGGTINGSIDDYLKEWPNAKGLALGYSQGSGPEGDNLLTLIQGGCVKVTFNIPPAPGAETKQEVVEGQPNCDTRTVEIITTTYERTGEWDEDSQTYVWGPWTPTGSTTTSRTATALECPTTVTAVDPSVKAAVCTTPTTPGLASYTILSTPGVEYFKNGSSTPIAAGTYTAAANETVVITAKAVDDTYLLSNPDWSWPKTFPGIVCVLQLPMTGQDVTGIVLLMLSLVAAGIALIHRSRRGYAA